MKTRTLGLSALLIISLLLAVTFSPRCFAQSGNYTWGSWEDRSASATSKDGKMPQVTPTPSIRKVDVGASGSFNLSLPLVNVPGRAGLNFPIALNYTPGVRVTQEASWVGLGWDLSVGGITRNIVGEMDDNIDKVWFTSPRNGYIEDDFFRDIYSVDCPGGTGKLLQFINATDQNQYDFVPEDWRPWKVAYQAASHRFLVTMEDGTIYVFGFFLTGASTNTRLQLPVNLPLDPDTEPFIEWKLTAILSSDYVDGGGDSYVPADAYYSSNAGSWIQIDWSFDGGEIARKKYYFSTRGYNTLDTSHSLSDSWKGINLQEVTYPSRIITPTHIATFETEPEEYNPISARLDDYWPSLSASRDWDTYFNADPTDYVHQLKRRLKVIKIYRRDFDGTIPQNLGTPLSVANFAYMAQSDFSSSAYHEKRTMLKSVQIVSGNVSLNPYSFAYYDILGSARQTLFNGSINGTSYEYVGAYASPSLHQVGNWGWLNMTLRDLTDPLVGIYGIQDDAKMWTLSSVTYPTGGSLTFDYESNKYVVDFSGKGMNGANFSLSNQAWGGGPRLTRQTVDDLSSTRTFTYTYGTVDHNGNVINGVGRLYSDPFDYWSAHLGRETLVPPVNDWLYNQANHPILYGQVTELQSDNSSKIVSHYAVASLDEDLIMTGSYSDQALYGKTLKKRGSLLQTDYLDDSGVMVRKDEIGVLEAVKRHYLSQSATPIYLSVFKTLDTTRTTSFSGAQSLSDTSWTFYNSRNGLDSLNIRRNSDGTRKESHVSYPADYSPTGGTGVAAALTQLCSSNILIAPVESWVSDGNSTYRASLTNYLVFSGSKARRASELALYSPTPISDFHPAYMSSQVFTSDSRYRTQKAYTQYDAYGNILQATDANGTSSVTVWGFNASRQVGTIVGASTQNSAISVFDDGDLSHWTGSAGTWALNNGSYQQTSTTATEPWLTPKIYAGVTIGDGVVEGDIRFDNEGTLKYAALAKVLDANHEILFELRKTDVAAWIEVVTYGGATATATCSFSFNENQWYHVRGELQGNRARLYIDGTLVCTLISADVNIGQGTVGLATYQTKASFDNVRIYPLSAVATSATYDPATLWLSAQTDANGKTLTNDHDGLGRLTGVRTIDGRRLMQKNYSQNLMSTAVETFSCPSLVRNGSFEGTLTNDWTLESGMNPFPDWTFEKYVESGLGTTLPDGNQVVVFWGPDGSGNSLLKQSLGLFKNGKTYVARVFTQRFWSTTAIGKLAFRTAGGTVLASTTITTDDRWQAMNISYTSTSDQEVFICLYAPTDGGLFYDFVTVQEGTSLSDSSVVISASATKTVDMSGRETITEVSSSDGDITVKSYYDNMGRLCRRDKPGIPSHPDPADPYAFELFEYFADPLGRLRHSHPPGVTYQNEGTGHYTKLSYGFNSAGEINQSASTLFTNTTQDENTDDANAKRIEYRDRFSNLVASRVKGTSLDLLTKYEYDLPGNLTKSIPPMGANYSSSYQYSTLGKVNWKISPDAGAVRYLYDNNGNERFVKDSAHTDPATNNIQYSSPYISSSTSGSLSRLTMPGRLTIQLNVVNIEYDEYLTVSIKANGVALYSLSTQGWEGPSGSIILPKGNYSYDAVVHGTQGTFSFTITSTTGYEFVYKKYDPLSRLIEVGEYESNSMYGSFTDTNARTATFPSSSKLVHSSFMYDSVATEALAVNQRNLVGRLSSATSYRLGQVALNTYFSYDDFGRIEWMVETGLDSYGKKIYFSYDLQSKLIRKSYVDFGCPNNNYAVWYEYDKTGKLARVYSGSDSLSRFKDAEYSFTAGGRVNRAKLGAAPTETVNYSYNDRDWMWSINSPHFAETMDFIGGLYGSNAQYNGNIGSIKWKTATLDSMAFGFSYDKADRLTKSLSWKKPSGTWNPVNDFQMDLISYDANGNIDTLFRNSSTGLAMDRLKYRYLSNSNRIDSIQDQVAAGSFTRDLDSQPVTNYAYDDNGNLQRSKGDSVSFVINDLNNLPVSVFKANGGVISYWYDHAGRRVKKSDGSTTTAYVLGENGAVFVIADLANQTKPTYYVDGGGVVGRVDRDGPGISRYYFLKDHLGSIRTTVKGTDVVLSDDFSSGNLAKWVTVLGGGFSVQSGELVGNGAGGDNVLINNSVGMFGDGVVRADVENLTGGAADANLVIRYQDPNNYYLIQAYNTQIIIFKKVAGAYYAQAQVGGLQTFLGGFFPLQATVMGANFTIYWKGQQVLTWTDPSVTPWLSGKVGVRQCLSRNIHWDNFAALTIVPTEVVSYDDFYPFGQTMDTRSSVQGDTRARYKYTGKERDTETGFDYFGARYYDARIGRFVSVDPLSSSQTSWSSYHYSFDNPVRYIDASGTIPGEYYDEQGNKIGDDNNPDKKVYITDKKTIQRNTTDKKTNWASVQSDNSTALLPTAETRAMLGVLIQKATPNNEVGGVIGVTTKGEEKVLSSPAGAPGDAKQAEIAIWPLETPGDIANIKEVSGEWHTHPSLKSQRTSTGLYYDQPPSGVDISNHLGRGYSGNSYVFGMGDGKVYIYNSTVIRTVPISFFVKP